MKQLAIQLAKNNPTLLNQLNLIELEELKIELSDHKCSTTSCIKCTMLMKIYNEIEKKK